MSIINEALLNSIISDGESPIIKKQLKAVKKLCEKVFTEGADLNDNIIDKLVPTLVKMLKSKNTKVQIDSAFFIANILERKIQAVVDQGAIPLLINNLNSKNSDVLEQTLTCIGNIGADFGPEVIDAIPILAKLLESNDENICKKSCWALGNITCEKGCIQVKQKLIEEHKAIPYIKKLLTSSNNEIVKEILGIVSNIADGNVTQKRALIDHEIVKLLIKLLQSKNHEVSEHASWAIGSLANGGTIAQKQYIINLEVVPIFVKQLCSKKGKVAEFAACALKDLTESKEDDIPEIIQTIINANAVRHLINLLKSSDVKVCDESMGALINISSCDHNQCQHVIDAGALKFIKNFITHPDLSERAIQFIENATSYNEAQVDQVIQERMIPLIIQQINNADNNIQKRAVDVIKNVTKFKPNYISLLVDMDIISSLCNLLVIDDVETLKIALSCLIEIFEKAGNNIDKIHEKFENCDGQEKIIDFKNHNDEEIRELAKSFFKHPPPPIPTVNFSGVISDEPVADETSALRKLNVGKWEYRRDATSEKERQIIVFEPNDQLLAREYLNKENDMYCLGCYNMNPVQKRLAIKKAGFIYVPLDEDHFCNPRDVGEITKEQESYLKKSRKRTQRRETSSITNRSTRSKKSRTASSFERNNSETSISADRDFDVGINDINDMPGSSSHSRTNVTPRPTSSSNHNSHTANNDARAATSRIEEEDPSATVDYCIPSEYFRRKSCDKFGIEYNRNAVKNFCDKDDIEKIKPTSKPAKVYHINESKWHGFSCLSIYFTGSEGNTIDIKDKINEYFFENSTPLGHEHLTPDNKSSMKQIMFSKVMTVAHFELITRWLQCRIGIYENGAWQKFGNWDEKDVEISTLLMEKKGEKYQPILSLKD